MMNSFEFGIVEYILMKLILPEPNRRGYGISIGYMGYKYVLFKINFQYGYFIALQLRYIIINIAQYGTH